MVVGGRSVMVLGRCRVIRGCNRDLRWCSAGPGPGLLKQVAEPGYSTLLLRGDATTVRAYVQLDIT